MIGMSATCQIPLIAFYGRSGSMLHEIERRRASAIEKAVQNLRTMVVGCDACWENTLDGLSRPSHSLRGKWFERARERYYNNHSSTLSVKVVLIFNLNHWISSLANQSISDLLSPCSFPSLYSWLPV